MARYGLARHVFVCRDEEFIVVLDLKQDRYFALEAAKTAPLGEVLPGWPAPPPPQGTVSTENTAEEIAAPLVGRGWLLESQEGPGASGPSSRDATPVVAPGPETELIRTTDVSRARLKARTVVAFVVASVLAKFVLRFWRFERVIERVARRKSRRSRPGPVDLERLRQLVDAFDRLRVFLFSSREECLHDSLAVIEFLAQHGVFPAWVFGVRARPFIAHCWVQSGGAVCNDTVEHVSTYVPIMVV
jgi:transglutaminase superfamily protein